MNAKALLLRVTDVPSSDYLRVSVDVSYIGTNGAGFLGVYNLDAYFGPEDTVTQIRSKIRDAIIAHAATLGYNVTATNVSSVMQI